MPTPRELNLDMRRLEHRKIFHSMVMSNNFHLPQLRRALDQLQETPTY